MVEFNPYIGPRGVCKEVSCAMPDTRTFLYPDGKVLVETSEDTWILDFPMSDALMFPTVKLDPLKW